MSENDAQLELKKRARRRLVGAIALAVLAAVVLPMVMDREPKPAAQDIQIRIPNQDAGSFSSRILAAKPGAPIPTPTALPFAAPPEASPGVEAPKAEPVKAAAAPPAPAKAEKAAAPAPEPRAAPADDKLPGKKPEEARPEPARAGGKEEPAKTEAAPTGGEQWIVQIGAYRDAANVRNLQAKLKEQGYNFYTEPLVSDGLKKTRVRAGPFPSKEAAEKARDRLKRIGVDGLVAQKQ
ncbi:MAG: SPOR domain-containing protein [Rhodocyclales bacterium]|nr:SPOR domain-containing protein [Rhodocyclales bacterium]